MKTIHIIGLYVAAMVAANFSVMYFGPSVTAINAFLLIGLDLTVRDVLHTRIKWFQMAALIIGTSVITFAININAQNIAIASSVAFLAASAIDWAVFNLAGRYKLSWLARSTASNVAGSAVDSILFPLLAFGAFMPLIVAGQFVAKVFGGLVWAFIFKRVSVGVKMNHYEYRFVVTCPTNGKEIDYTLFIRTKNVIMVEKLIDEVSKFTTGYHEPIADKLVEVLGGEQTIIAHHHGVTIKTKRGFV